MYLIQLKHKNMMYTKVRSLRCVACDMEFKSNDLTSNNTSCLCNMCLLKSSVDDEHTEFIHLCSDIIEYKDDIYYES